MKRKVAGPFLAVLADDATPLSALGALVSLTDTAKHLELRSARHALRSVKEQELQQSSRIPDGVHERRRPFPAEGSGVRGGRLRASLSRARARGALLALAALAAAAPALAQTEHTVPQDWSLRPDAVAAGGTTHSSWPLGTGNFQGKVATWYHSGSTLQPQSDSETASRSFLGLSPVFVVSSEAPVTTLVSNTGEDLRTNSTGNYQAQAFTAGADATISEILIHLNVAEGMQTSVKLREDDGGEPGDLVATFVNPGTFADGALHAFTAPSGTTVTVEAGETYWVSVNEGISSNGDRVFYSRTSEHGETGEPDWEIGDTRLWRNAETANWSSSNAVLSMAVKGTVGTVTASSDATLSGLTLSEGTLDPAFASDHYEYAASVALATARIAVTPTTGHSAAAVAYQDAGGAELEDADGVASNGHQVDLDAGANTVNVVVTAEDGGTTRTYAVTVWRPACAVPLGDRTEIWSSVLAVGAVPDANSDTVGYGFHTSASVGGLSDGDFGFGGTDHSVGTLWVENNGTLQLNISSSLPEDDFPALRLHACGDPFGLTDADDFRNATNLWDSSGLDWSSETGVSVALSASPDATLSGLSLSTGALSPTFASDVLVYTVSVPHATARITVTPTVNEAGAKVDYRDGDDMALADADTLTEGQQVDLDVGGNTVKLLVTSGDRANSETYTVTVTRAANVAPVFNDGPSTTRAVAENTASGQNVGTAVAATDMDSGDTLTYSKTGDDAAEFGLNDATGQLLTATVLDHENPVDANGDGVYEVTVSVADGNGGMDSIDVSVTVTDVIEKPSAPRAVFVRAESATSLSVSWIEAENTGPRALTYDLRYRPSGGNWTDGPQDLTHRREVIGSLIEGTKYEVQVRAENAEGMSDWSESGSGRPREKRTPVLTVEAHGTGRGGLARFEVWRRTGAVSTPVRYARVDVDDREVGVESRGVLPGGRRFDVVFLRLNSRGRASVRLLDPVEPYCGNPGAARNCTDEYEVGSPASATVDVRASSSVPVDAFVSGGRLTLRYAQALDATSTPGQKDWVVTAATDTGARTLAVTGVSVSEADAVLALSPPAGFGEAVTLDYLPWAMHPLLDGDGVEAAPLTELAVRNETPRPRLPKAPAGARAQPDNAVGLPGTGVPRLPPAEWLSALLAEKPASAVTRLDLRDRNLTYVSALAGLADLETLDLSGNAVADAWPLAGLVNLKRLNLSGNRIGDVSALAGLTGLEALDLSGNAVADAWPLAGLVNLKRLDLSGNPLGDVSALAGLAGLEVLVLDGGGVAEVLPLASLPRLARLDLSDNAVADVRLLAELRSLARLDLSGNRIAAVDPLGDLSHLLWLDLTGNPVADAAPLGRLTALRWLWLNADSASEEDQVAPMDMARGP